VQILSQVLELESRQFNETDYYQVSWTLTGSATFCVFSSSSFFPLKQRTFIPMQETNIRWTKWKTTRNGLGDFSRKTNVATCRSIASSNPSHWEHICLCGRICATPTSYPSRFMIQAQAPHPWFWCLLLEVDMDEWPIKFLITIRVLGKLAEGDWAENLAKDSGKKFKVGDPCKLETN